MLYDIRSENSAKQFLEEFLDTSIDTFIKKYKSIYNFDFDHFWEENSGDICSKNIEHYKFVVMHYTSNMNECTCIKNNGIKNLQWVLTEDTELNNFFKIYGVSFDVKGRIISVNGKEIFNNSYKCGHIETDFDIVRKIVHKIYSDYQINGYFYKNDRSQNIYRRPEFIMNISKLTPFQSNIENHWIEKSKGYIVTYLADFKQFQMFTFDIDDSYDYDINETMVRIKKWMINNAINRIPDCIDSSTDVIAYMNFSTTIDPSQIIEFKEIII